MLSTMEGEKSRKTGEALSDITLAKLLPLKST